MISLAALLLAASSLLGAASAGAAECRGRNLVLTLPQGYHCARSASDMVTGWSVPRSDLHVSLLPPWAAGRVAEFAGSSAEEGRLFHKALEVSARGRGRGARLSPLMERGLLNGTTAQYFTEGDAASGRRALHGFVNVGLVVYHVYSVLPEKGPHGPEELFRILGSLRPPSSGR